MKLNGWMILAGGVLASIAVLGCSSSEDEKCNTIQCDTVPTGGAGQGGNTGEGGFSFPGSGGTTAGGGMGTGTGGIAQVCEGIAYDPETLPVDIFIMFDQSSSMLEALPPPGTGTWWQAASQAIVTFVNSPAAAGVGVGLQYFPLNGVAPASCTANYSTPEVPVADLPGNAGPLAQSIQSHQPTTFTPTGPALAGAIAHMKQWGPTRPGRAPIVVLVTDGFPTECEPQQIADIAVIAKNAFETEPKVRTFVVGFNLGQGKENLNQIAKAGGTDKAFFIDNGDVGAQFVSAMLSITAAPLQCSFDIPKPTDGKVLDLKQVAVEFTPNLPPQTPELLPFMQQPGDCVYNQDKGFYYDNVQTPKKIVLCPDTCSKLAQGVLTTKLGCKPPMGITR